MSQPMLIAPFVTGLQTDVQPWLAPPDSFSELNNMHIEHGFLERRNGYQYFAPKGDSTLKNGTAVTGFGTYIETASGAQTMLAFDTRSAYTYSGVTKSFVQLKNATGAMSATIFSSENYDYVVSAAWQSTAISNVNRLYFTNGKSWNSVAQTDGLWYFSGGGTVTPLQPNTSSTIANYLVGGKLIFSVGQRLIVLYTFESSTLDGASTRYPQRARWCAKQNPANWDEVKSGGGEFADAATSEQIISAQLLQNQIIVFFTNSVWTLLPTSDPNKAFRWQKINSFRSCDGKMASVSFDRFVGALGVRGITATDGNNTTRIDEKISDFTIDNISQDDFKNTFCARDYNNRRWWTLFTSKAGQQNDKALIYDDDSRGYSTYDISLNSLGYGISGFDWEFQDFTSANNKDFSFRDFGDDETFGSYYYQAKVQFFVGGDTTGNIYQLETTSSDITDPISSTFTSAAWNPFKDQGRECLMPYIDIFVETSPTALATIYFYKDTATDPYKSQVMNFLPDLNFVSSIVGVSASNPCNINSPQNGLSTGDQIYIYQVEGMINPSELPEDQKNINSTEVGAPYTVTVVDENNFTIDGLDTTGWSAYSTGGSIHLREFYLTKVWKRVYSGAIGYQHRIGFESSAVNSPVRIHSLKPYFKAIGRRTINS